jgi:hypothetical protein
MVASFGEAECEPTPQFSFFSATLCHLVGHRQIDAVGSEVKVKTFSKAALLIGTAASVLAMATPAEARRGYYRHHDGIDAGDVIAGALVIGGIAAIASAASRDRGYRGGYYDDGYGYYDRGYSSRAAVDQCVRAAQNRASRYGWARVTDVTRIDRIRGGYEVRGRLVVQDRGWRGDYGRGWDRGYYYDRYNDGYDKGRFSCVTQYGGVRDVDLTGLRYY